MKLPWTKTENYQDSSSYSDALISSLLRQVRGRTAGAALTSETGRAWKAAAGLVGRSFAACQVVRRPHVHAGAESSGDGDDRARPGSRRGDS